MYRKHPKFEYNAALISFVVAVLISMKSRRQGGDTNTPARKMTP